MVYNPDQERVNRLINRLNNPRSEAADLPQGQQREGPNDRREEWNSDQPKETRASQILDALTGAHPRRTDEGGGTGQITQRADVERLVQKTGTVKGPQQGDRDAR